MNKNRDKYLKEYRKKNSERQGKYYIKWCKKNPDKIKYGYLMRNYGITVKQYNNMFNEQEGKCEICGTHQDELNRKLYVDHNHKTNQVRGLLCNGCNTAIGYLKEDTEIIKNLLKYITKYKKIK